MATTELTSAIRRAFREAQSHRPYKLDQGIIDAAIPPGGDWKCVAEPGAVTRSIVWGSTEVALVNPRGDLDDVTEGQIAMAMRALPLTDATLRSIIALAESPDNMAVIRALAESAIGFIEMPAPRIQEPDEDGDEIDYHEEEEAERNFPFSGSS